MRAHARPRQVAEDSATPVTHSGGERPQLHHTLSPRPAALVATLEVIVARARGPMVPHPQEMPCPESRSGSPSPSQRSWEERTERAPPTDASPQSSPRIGRRSGYADASAPTRPPPALRASAGLVRGRDLAHVVKLGGTGQDVTRLGVERESPLQAPPPPPRPHYGHQARAPLRSARPTSLGRAPARWRCRRTLFHLIARSASPAASRPIVLRAGGAARPGARRLRRPPLADAGFSEPLEDELGQHPQAPRRRAGPAPAPWIVHGSARVPGRRRGDGRPSRRSSARPPQPGVAKNVSLYVLKPSWKTRKRGALQPCRRRGGSSRPEPRGGGHGCRPVARVGQGVVTCRASVAGGRPLRAVAALAAAHRPRRTSRRRVRPRWLTSHSKSYLTSSATAINVKSVGSAEGDASSPRDEPATVLESVPPTPLPTFSSAPIGQAR